MDKLKRFVDDNRYEFDAAGIPPLGHRERFERKLSPKRVKGFYLYIVAGIAIAASLALLLFPNKGDVITIEKNNIDMKAWANEIEREKVELRIYYNMRFSDIKAELRKLYDSNRCEGTETILLEGRRILADNSDFENDVLPSLPCSDEAIFAMTQHYDNTMGGLVIMLDRMRSFAENINMDNN